MSIRLNDQLETVLLKDRLRHDASRQERRLYAKAQVPEYWVVDLQQWRLIVFRNPRASDYRQTTITTAGTLSPLAFPNLHLSVRRFLEGSLSR